jgi:hypothetical protein
MDSKLFSNALNCPTYSESLCRWDIYPNYSIGPVAKVNKKQHYIELSLRNCALRFQKQLQMAGFIAKFLHLSHVFYMRGIFHMKVGPILKDKPCSYTGRLFVKAFDL